MDLRLHAFKAYALSRIDATRRLSRILGWLLTFAGATMGLGFLYFMPSGGSPNPFWVDLLTLLVIGVLPSYSGIMLLRRRYRTLTVFMGIVSASCIVVSVLSFASRWLFPRMMSVQLNAVSKDCLIAAIICAVVWVIAWIRWQTRRQAKQDFEEAGRKPRA